jgi:hypothetical protein
MADRSEQLLQLSSRLTGFSTFQLRSTGMLDAYLEALDARLRAELLDELLASDDDAATMDDPKLGPIARNVIVMWYCGAWMLLPDAWTAAYGTKDKDLVGVISAAAYLARSPASAIIAGTTSALCSVDVVSDARPSPRIALSLT